MQLVSNQLETPVRLRSAWLISMSCSWKNFSFEATNLSRYPPSHLALRKSAMGIVQPGFWQSPRSVDVRVAAGWLARWLLVPNNWISNDEHVLPPKYIIWEPDPCWKGMKPTSQISKVAHTFSRWHGATQLPVEFSAWPTAVHNGPENRTWRQSSAKIRRKTWRLGEVVEASAPGFVWESKEAIGENLSPQAGVVDITADLQPSHHGRGWRPQMQPPEVLSPSQVYYGCVISSFLWVWMAGGYNSIIMYAISRICWTLVTPKIDLWSGFDFYIWAIEVEECFCVLFRGDGPQWFSIFGALSKSPSRLRGYQGSMKYPKYKNHKGWDPNITSTSYIRHMFYSWFQ